MKFCFCLPMLGVFSKDQNFGLKDEPLNVIKLWNFKIVFLHMD